MDLRIGDGVVHEYVAIVDQDEDPVVNWMQGDIHDVVPVGELVKHTEIGDWPHFRLVIVWACYEPSPILEKRDCGHQMGMTACCEDAVITKRSTGLNQQEED